MHALLVGQNWANGLLLGSLYAVAALGFALVWGVLNVINIAQGSMIIGGAYLTYVLFTRFGLDPYASLPLTMLAAFAFGWLLQRFVINHIVRAPMFMTLLLTFGVDLTLTVIFLALFHADPRQVNPSYAARSLEMGGMVLPVTRLVGLGVAVLITALLSLLLNQTRLGAMIRATAMDTQAAELVGIRVASVYALTFGISAALAAIAGALISTTQAFSPTEAPALTLKAFVVVALGGLGSAWAGLAGGLILGLAESVGGSLLGLNYTNLISFALLVIILVVRPSGVLGRRSYSG
jgi:branched-chain amino acid transport system permease protein